MNVYIHTLINNLAYLFFYIYKKKIFMLILTMILINVYAIYKSHCLKDNRISIENKHI